MIQSKSDKITRVLLWHWGRRGGGPNYTFELAKALASHEKLELHLSLSKQSDCFSRSKTLELPGFHVDTYEGILSFLVGSFRLHGLCKQFYNYLISNRIDLVYCTMTHMWNLFMLKAIRKARIKYLLTVHDATLHPGENSLLRQMLIAKEISKADRLVTLTDFVKKESVTIHGFSPEKITTVPHGPFSYGKNPLVSKKYPHNDHFNLLFFGRILPYKGVEILTEAFELVRKRYPETRLFIKGHGEHSLDSAKLRRLGVFMDNRWIPEDQIEPAFNQAHLLVTPYLEASQSGIIPLAYAKGLPVVATPKGGLIEQVTDGYTGLVCPSCSVQDLAQTLEKIIASPSLYEHLSSGALMFAKKELAWSNLVCRIVRIIEEDLG